MLIISIEHGLDFIIKVFIVQIINFDRLKYSLGSKCLFATKKICPNTITLIFALYTIYDIVIDVFFFLPTFRKLESCSVGSFSPFFDVAL